MSKEYLTKLGFEKIRAAGIQNEWQQERRRLMNKKFDFEHPELFHLPQEEFTEDDILKLDITNQNLKEIDDYLREINIHYCRVLELSEIDLVGSDNIHK
jgi:long-subunit acyl-CoA synthetase (AMP-forming)